jgi:two-component system sensor histidine kinase KdpD
VEPLYTLRVSSAADILALALFLFTAGLTGWLAGKARDDADAADRRAGHLGELSRFTAAVSQSSTAVSVFDALVRHIALITEQGVVVMQQKGDAMSPAAANPSNLQLDDFGLQACERAFRHGSGQPATAAGWQGSRFGFYPLIVDAKAAAVAGVRFPDVDRQRAAEIEQTVKTMIAQASAVLNRIGQAEKVEAARVRADQESLRSTLLLSLSHDLRTPLATILGSVSSLRQFGSALPDSARDDLLQATEEETQRLSRYVDDLLTMTRLNVGLQPHLDWVDPSDILNGAVTAGKERAPGSNIMLPWKARNPDPFGCLAFGASPVQLCWTMAPNFHLLEERSLSGCSKMPLGCISLWTIRGREFRLISSHTFLTHCSAAPIQTGKGTGLGLAIVKGIAILLKGTVELESPLKADGGTRFSLSSANANGCCDMTSLPLVLSRRRRAADPALPAPFADCLRLCPRNGIRSSGGAAAVCVSPSRHCRARPWPAGHGWQSSDRPDPPDFASANHRSFGARR